MEIDSPDEAAERSWLLAFAPVPRKCLRHDGWSADRQRDFVALLALTGSQSRAAHAVDRTARGAYQLRRDAGAEDFVRAWDRALALYKSWTAPPPRPAGAATPPARPAPAAADDEGGGDPAADLSRDAFVEGLLTKYLMKLDQERGARLAGRIIEADFYVRQLTWLEVALDLGGNAHKLLMELKRGGRHAGQIVATPMSVLLDSVRREYWAEEGGPERPPLAALGQHDGEISTGEPLECQHWPDRDGDYKQWPQHRDESAAVAAEAQRAWEEKARNEAEAWAKRLAEEGDANESETQP